MRILVYSVANVLVERQPESLLLHPYHADPPIAWHGRTRYQPTTTRPPRRRNPWLVVVLEHTGGRLGPIVATSNNREPRSSVTERKSGVEDKMLWAARRTFWFTFSICTHPGRRMILFDAVSGYGIIWDGNNTSETNISGHSTTRAASIDLVGHRQGIRPVIQGRLRGVA